MCCCQLYLSTLCLGAAWLGVPHLWQPLPQAAHHGAGRPAHVQQRAHRRGGQCYYYGCGLLRINTCAGILSGHDIFLSAYWLGWAGRMQILQSSFNNHGNFNVVFWKI